MSPVQFVIAIIGLVICIRSKNKLSRIGIIFFSLIILQFVYSMIRLTFLTTLIEDMGINRTMDEAIFDRYSTLLYIPEIVLKVSSLITIIIGIIRYSD